MSVLSFEGVNRFFKQGEAQLHVLNDVSFELKEGEIVGLLGSSGSGKTTLLQLAGLLDDPSSGTISIKGDKVQGLRDREKTRLRLRFIGFVYQFHYLLPEFSALENVMIPQKIAKVPYANSLKRALDLLERMGLKDRINHFPSQLSGGEQQRVAIARALANKPSVLLADEPTGNLDFETTQNVFQEFLQVVKEEGRTALIATHDLQLRSRMDRLFEIKRGLFSVA